MIRRVSARWRATATFRVGKGGAGLAMLTIALLSALPARAETVSFEADAGILVVRGRQSGSTAVFEFLADGKSRVQCVALGRDGRPLAVGSTYANTGTAMFSDLDVREIDKVLCRRRD